MTNNEAATILSAMKALYVDADGAPISSAYTALEKALILLVQVPDNHGDLIDRDELKKKKAYSHERHEYVVPVAYIDWEHAVIEGERKDDEQIH